MRKVFIVVSVILFSFTNIFSNLRAEIDEFICAQKIHMLMDSYDYKLTHFIGQTHYWGYNDQCKVIFSQTKDIDNFNKLAFFMKRASQNRNLFMDRYINEEQLQTLLSTSLYDLKLKDGIIETQTDKFDVDTLNRLLSAAGDFKKGKLTEIEFDKIKNEILKDL